MSIALSLCISGSFVTSYLVRGRGFAFVCAYTRVSKIKRHRGLLQVRLSYRRQIDVNVVERLLAMHLFQMCWAWFVYQHTKRHFEWVSYSSAIAKLVDDQLHSKRFTAVCLRVMGLYGDLFMFCL